jgi:hypothetical protein
MRTVLGSDVEFSLINRPASAAQRASRRGSAVSEAARLRASRGDPTAAKQLIGVKASAAPIRSIARSASRRRKTSTMLIRRDGVGAQSSTPRFCWLGVKLGDNSRQRRQLAIRAVLTRQAGFGGLC